LVKRDKNGKVIKTDKFGEQIFYNLYIEPEPVPPKEPENLDLG